MLASFSCQVHHAILTERSKSSFTFENSVSMKYEVDIFFNRVFFTLLTHFNRVFFFIMQHFKIKDILLKQRKS